MLNLKNLKLLILEENNLVNLTTNSLDINNPEIKYSVVKPNGSRIKTALNNINDITLVVKSGLVLNLKNKDFPSRAKIKNYHMAVSRYGVFIDHDRLKEHYRYVDKNIHDSVLDLSIFVMNPYKWEKIPDSDEGVLHDKKLLYMPRYMNHKDDVLFKQDATAAIDAFYYGVLGEQAVVYNYTDTIQRETENILETYGYCFDKLLPYLKGVPDKEKRRIEYLSQKTSVRIKNTREKIHRLYHE